VEDNRVCVKPKCGGNIIKQVAHPEDFWNPGQEEMPSRIMKKC